MERRYNLKNDPNSWTRNQVEHETDLDKRVITGRSSLELSWNP